MGLLGAEIIKVESAAQLDAARRAPYSFDDPDNSPAFNGLNLNKLSVRLNLKQPRAVELALRLASLSDVVLENMRPGVMDRLGLGYDRLKELNPSIIMASVSTAGSVGPEASYPGYAPAFSALSGLAHLTGYSDGPPGELHASIDSRSGATAAFIILAALFHRRRTGEGQFIDFASREAITALGAEALMDYSMNGRVQTRQGNRSPGFAPQGCYRCKGDDSWVSIAVDTEREWYHLCLAAGHAEWANDPRFNDAPHRYDNHDALDELIGSWTWHHTASEVTEILQAAGVAASPSMSAADIAADPHLEQRGMWQDIEHPFMGNLKVQCPPWRLSANPPTIRTPGPLLGEHNRDVIVGLLGESELQLKEWVDEEVLN
jgi:crotonobetainyl-CoA:carnitine CoA-transferase CaiB-like acyl-CoA transferase